MTYSRTPFEVKMNYLFWLKTYKHISEKYEENVFIEANACAANLLN